MDYYNRLRQRVQGRNRKPFINTVFVHIARLSDELWLETDQKFTLQKYVGSHDPAYCDIKCWSTISFLCFFSSAGSAKGDRRL